MKNILPAFLFPAILIAACTLHAQVAPSILWQKSLGGSSIDFPTSVQQCSDGGFIVAGQSQSGDGDVSGNYGNADYWVVKLDTGGNLTWQKSLGGSDTDLANSIQQTTDGGFIVAGYARSTDFDVTGNHGLNDYWIVKLDTAGNIVWQKCFGGTGVDQPHSIQQTNDGGFIVAGTSNSNDGDVSGNQGSFDYWIVKLDIAGNIGWQKSFGGTGYDEAFSAKQTSDGGYIVAGNSNSNDSDVTSNHGGLDYWIVKLDSVGTLIWQKSLGGSDEDYSTAAQETTDGGFIVAGYTSSTNGNVTGNHGFHDCWIVKLNASGTVVWKKCFGGSSYDFASSIRQMTDNGFVFAGYSSSNNGDVTGNHGNYDYWMVRTNETGGLLWQKSLGGSNGEISSSFDQTNDGGFIVAGSSDSNDGDVSGNHGFEDYWIVKLSTDGSTGMVSHSNNGISIYPNPAATQLYIQFPQPENKEVIVINILGEQLMKQAVPSQSNNITLDISALPEGAYIIRFSTAKTITTTKFVKE